MTEKRFRISQGYSDKFCHDWEKNKLLNFRQTVDLLNNLNDENEDLKKEIERITKDKENWAFISDCSVQVMNEEEKFKEDYLRIATNNLKKLQEENEKLKQSYTKLKHRHSLLHDVCIEAECDRDSYCKDVLSLEKENEQLQKDCTALIYHNQEYRKENEQLKSEIKGMRELLKSYRKTIKHDAELLADATKNGYLPPLGEWKEVEK